MNRILRVLAVVSLALSACGSEPPATDVAAVAALSSPAASTACKAPGDEPNGPKLEVMTRNLYLGADIFAVTQATTPEEILAAATEFWVKVQMTDFPARAKVIADEIFWARPEVLGLQEVTTYRTGDPLVCASPASADAPVAEHVELDFLAILQAELRRRGLHYEVAARVTSTDVELCVADPKDPTNQLKFRDLRYTDHEVLLVRKDVKWRNPTLPVPTSAKPGDSNGALFAKDWTAFFDIGGATIYAWRGWTATEVRVGHEWVRVFETHLEDQLPIDPPWAVQAAQAGELIGILDGSLQMAPLPTVLLGDFNVYKQPDADSVVYDFLTGGDFPLDPRLNGISPLNDAWTSLRPHDPGFTWGFDELLRSGTFSTTLDLVLATEGLHPLFTYRVGLHDRTRSGLHPSDHAGLVTTFSVR